MNEDQSDEISDRDTMGGTTCAEPQATSERTISRIAGPFGSLGVVGGSAAAGRVDILRREGRRWWRREQKAALRRDYLAAHEYAALSDKYYDAANAAERLNIADLTAAPNHSQPQP